MSNAAFIKRVVNSLIGRYGTEVIFKNETARSRNTQTGAIARQYRQASAVSLVEPANAKRDFVYDLSFIAANKNFTYGGLFDVEVIMLTFLKSALPSDFIVDLKTTVIIRNKYFIVEKIETEQSNEYFKRIIVKATEDVKPTEIVVTGIVSFGLLSGGTVSIS